MRHTKGHSKNLGHEEWFDPNAEPCQGKERRAHEGLVWQCRHSGSEVPPDVLWQHTTFGAGLPCADDRADNMRQNSSNTFEYSYAPKPGRYWIKARGDANTKMIVRKSVQTSAELACWRLLGISGSRSIHFSSDKSNRLIHLRSG